jgi:hypothetical protein
MSNQNQKGPLIASAVLGAVGVILCGTSTAITGAASLDNNSASSALRTSAATIGFGTIILIIALIILLIYFNGRYKGHQSKGLIITFWILAALCIILMLIGSVIAGVEGNNKVEASRSTMLYAAAILPVFGIIAFLIAFVILNHSAKIRVEAKYGMITKQQQPAKNYHNDESRQREEHDNSHSAPVTSRGNTHRRTAAPEPQYQQSHSAPVVSNNHGSSIPVRQNTTPTPVVAAAHGSDDLHSYGSHTTTTTTTGGVTNTSSGGATGTVRA